MKYENYLLIPFPVLLIFYGIIYFFDLKWIFPKEGTLSFSSVPLYVATIMYVVFWIFILGLCIKVGRKLLKKHRKNK